MCYADTLQVWFPAQLQQKEDEYRAANLLWVDQNDESDDIRQQWHDVQANRGCSSRWVTRNRAKYGC